MWVSVSAPAHLRYAIQLRLSGGGGARSFFMCRACLGAMREPTGCSEDRGHRVRWVAAKPYEGIGLNPGGGPMSLPDKRLDKKKSGPERGRFRAECIQVYSFLAITVLVVGSDSDMMEYASSGGSPACYVGSSIRTVQRNCTCKEIVTR